MVMDFPNSDVLLQTALEQRLYDRLVAQLEKDFVLANIHFDLPSDIAPETLTAVLVEKIYVLILERFNDYINLLYIVDVPEKVFREIQCTDAVELARAVAFLILKRELQKVWFKAKYSA